MARKTLSFLLPGIDGPMTVTGQAAKTLESLAAAGAAGVTALECASWAFRLAHYIHVLRRQHGLSIDMLREEHCGGWHARYVLRTPVRLLDEIGKLRAAE
jgi:hypothetical protein